MSLREIRYIYRKVKKILFATIHGFFDDDCYTKASTLTFYTFQSIIPFFAFLIGIAKGFGFSDYLQKLIVNLVKEEEQSVNSFFLIANSLLTHIKEGVVIGFGVLLLIWAIINLMSYIEEALNQVWKIKIERTFLRKVTDYIAITIILPLILIASSSFTVFLKTNVSYFYVIPYFEKINVYLLALLHFTPWVLSWALFFLLYVLIPNTRVRIYPRIFAGIIAGSGFQLWQLFYFRFQIQLFDYNVVYGSFATIPLLLIWLQVSWIIALIGAELSFSIEDILYERDENAVDVSGKQLGLIIALYCMEPFYSTSEPLTCDKLTKILKIPQHITQKMLDILTQGNVFVPVATKEGIGYVPYKDPSIFTLKDVSDVIEKNTDFTIKLSPTKYLTVTGDLMKQIDEAGSSSSANQSFKELLFTPGAKQ